MKRFFGVLGFIFVCVPASFSQGISLTDNPELVKTATDLLGQKYTGYSVMKLKDMGKPLQEYFLKNYPKEYPGLILGNFRP